MSAEAVQLATDWFRAKAEMRALAAQQKTLRKQLKTYEEDLLPLLAASSSKSVTVEGRTLTLESRVSEE